MLSSIIKYGDAMARSLTFLIERSRTVPVWSPYLIRLAFSPDPVNARPRRQNLSKSLIIPILKIAAMGRRLDLFFGTRAALAGISSLAVQSLFWGLACLFLLFLLRVLLRREWVAALLFVVITTAFFGLDSESPLTWIWNALEWIATYFILIRFGLLANTVTFTFALCLYQFPITPQLSAWYSGIGLAGVVLLLGLAAYAFHTFLGGQPLFGRASLED